MATKKTIKRKNSKIIKDNQNMTGRQKLKSQKIKAQQNRSADQERTARTKARATATSAAIASMNAQRESTNRAQIKANADSQAIQKQIMNIINGNINGESATGENPSSPSNGSWSSIEVE